MDPRRQIRSAFLSLLLIGLVGCAYRLGPTNGVVAGSKSIEIAPFQNETMEPRLIEAVATALRRKMQQDGTYKLDTQGGGDIIVTGVILSYDRGALSFQPSDILSVRDYEITLTAHILAKDKHSGALLLDKAVKGRTTVRILNDLTSSERQAVPLLAQDLARNITSLLTDGSW
jgi:hypothetical protein